MSLRTRIMLATALALAVVAVSTSVIIWTAIRSELRGTVERQLREVAEAPVPDRRFAQLPPRPMPGRMERFGGARGLRQIVLPDGAVVRESGTDPGTVLPVDEEDRRIARRGGGEFVRDVTVDGVHVLVLTIGTPAGALQVARPLEEADRVLDRAAMALLLITIVGIGLAAALGRLVADVALRPVARFTDEAEEIAAGSDARRRLGAHSRDEIGRLAESFNRTLDTLERSLDAQRRLIADAGHELRTPIASVRANVQLLERADELPADDVAEIRRDIVLELDELTELLADVIELARGADPDAPVDEVRLDEVVRDSAERAVRRGDSNVSVELDLEPTVVVGDAPRIARALANVVDNARKWSPDGGVIHVSMHDGTVRVRDEGPGIPEAELDLVWDRFHRADTARSMSGSGLGLAIVRQIVEAHGGRAKLRNAPGGGAEVDLSFGQARPPDPGAVEVRAGEA